MSTDSSDGEDAFESVCEELVDRILAGEIERDDLESAKTEVCGEIGRASCRERVCLYV